MKDSLLFLLIFVSAVTGCGKNEPAEPFDPFKGEGSAELNGKYWEAEVYGYNFKNDSLSISFYTKRQAGVLKEELLFSKIPFLVQQNLLTRSTFSPFPTFPTSYYAIVDGDVLLEWYILTPDSSSHYLEITALDSSTDEIEGRFETTLIIHPDKGKSFPSSPDTIAFKNGKFKVKVKR